MVFHLKENILSLLKNILGIKRLLFWGLKDFFFKKIFKRFLFLKRFFNVFLTNRLNNFHVVLLKSFLNFLLLIFFLNLNLLNFGFLVILFVLNNFINLFFIILFRKKKLLFNFISIKTRIAGIEPTHAVLKTTVLPLNYIPKIIGITGLAPLWLFIQKYFPIVYVLLGLSEFAHHYYPRLS